jgi:hypothetical protein
VKAACLQLVEGASKVVLRGPALRPSHLRMTFRDLDAVILRRSRDALRERAGGVGRGRARCGGDGQRHGNLLERADLRA